MGKMIDFLGTKIPGSELAAHLGGLDDGKVSSTLEAVLRKIAREEAKKPRASLTWNAGAPQSVPNDQKFGLLNKRLPYNGPYGGKGGFYVHNCMILDSAGNERQLEDIPDVEQVWFDKSGQRVTAPSTRSYVRDALERYKAQAAEQDPDLCNVCFKERFRDAQERMRHMYYAHPVEFAEAIGAPSAPEIELPVSAIPDPVRPLERVREGLVCNCGNGKQYADARALAMHMRVAKVHRAPRVQDIPEAG
jgi:hypothetical protein